jgi:NAD(P)-dependent dehydrogenase (short-subunit alcohol dehydrogenase family)
MGDDGRQIGREMSNRTALVTGANRGIGFEVCRQLGRHGSTVILTADGVSAAVKELRDDGLDVAGEVLDVSSEASVLACAARLEQQGRRVEVLVNNAGVLADGDLLTASSRTISEAMGTNFFGALWTARAWMPAMNRRGYGRVVNVTSGYGSFAEGPLRMRSRRQR